MREKIQNGGEGAGPGVGGGFDSVAVVTKKRTTTNTTTTTTQAKKKQTILCHVHVCLVPPWLVY